MARAVGIDQGTANSVIAAWEGGEARVIPNAQGSVTTPSVVAFTESAKRFIGRRYDEVAEEAKAVSFDVVPGPNGLARFKIRDRLLLLDVTPLSLGVETRCGVMTRIIDRNTTISAGRTETRNELDSVACQVERRLAELGDAVPEHERARAEMLVKEATELIRDEGPAGPARELASELQQLYHSLSARADSCASDASGAAEQDEDVVDAEFERS